MCLHPNMLICSHAKECFSGILQPFYRITVTKRRISSSDHSPATGFIFFPLSFLLFPLPHFSFILSLLVCQRLFLWIRSDLSRGHSNPSITSNLTCVCWSSCLWGSGLRWIIHEVCLFHLFYSCACSFVGCNRCAALPAFNAPVLVWPAAGR